MKYTVRDGDSPLKIAKKLGVTFASLIAANSQKPTTVIGGIRTWASLQPDEVIFVPVGSAGVQIEPQVSLDVEATAGAAISVLNADSNYCVSVRHPRTPVNVAVHSFKKAWNASGQDIQLPINTGKYEHIVARALSVVMPHLPVPPGCDRREETGVGATFSEPANDAGTPTHVELPDAAPGLLPGNSGFDALAPVPSTGLLPGGSGFDTLAPVTAPAAPAAPALPAAPAPAAPATSNALTTAATAAAAALNADADHCKSVGHPGSAVNKAVHAFKQVWNAANPGSKVPVGTGHYEASVAAALTSILGAGSAPDGCAATARRVPPPPALPVAMHSHDRVASAAAQALAAVDPCSQANVQLVWDFQKSVGQDPDGKYGTHVAGALSKQMPGAPAGCSPRPSWWAPHGQKNYPGVAAPVPPPPPVVAPVVAAPPPEPPTIAPAAPAPTDTTVPEPPPVDTTAAAVPEPPPVAPAAPASTVPEPPPVTAGGHGKGKKGGLVPPQKNEISTTTLIVGGVAAAALLGIIAAGATSTGRTIVRRVYRKAKPAAPAPAEYRR